MTRYVIVGNSAGCIGAIEAIRQVDRQGTLTGISEEPYPAYSRPQIGRYLAGEVGLEKTLFRPRTFYDEQRVDLLLGRRVAELNTARRVVALDDGRELPWDKLLLATGGTPIVPSVQGLEQIGYHTFMTLEDVQRLRERAPRMRHVLVIGGGLIGLSAVEALVKLGIQTTVIELAPQILGRALDGIAAGMVQRLLERHGVRILTGCSLAAVETPPHPASEAFATLPEFQATLSNHTALAADTVIMAIGVRPRLELAAQAGLVTNRGIVVDSHMQTSRADVYACGDVAEAYDIIAGGPRLTPIWPNAFLGGRIAGLNMAGEERIYGGGTSMNALHFFGYSLLSAGLVAPEATTGCEIITSQPAPGVYKKVVLQDGCVVGFIFAGEVDRAGIVYHLLKNRICVRGFADKLVQADLGLLSLPPALRAEMLGTQAFTVARVPAGVTPHAL